MFGGGGSIQLARVYGIRIGASPSWFIVLFLLIYLLSGYFRDTLDASQNTGYLVAVLAAFLFFVSLALHELGHAVVAKRNGIEVAGIDLWLLGGIAKLGRDARTPGEEFRVAAAGPAVTAIVIVVAFGAALGLSEAGGFLDAATFEEEDQSAAVALLGWLGAVNLVLLVFNLLPAFPLDGGRIARALVWRITGDRNRATRAAARLGVLFAWILVGVGLVMAFTTDPVSGIWLMVVGWFIVQGARGAVVASEFSERLEGVTVGDLMDDEPVSVPGATPAVQARDEFFLRYGWPWFPVTDTAGRYVGVLRSERVEGAVQAGQPALSAGELTDGPSDRDFLVRSDEPLEDLLGSEPLRRLGALVVVDAEQRLCGVLTADRVRRAIAATAAGRIDA